MLEIVAGAVFAVEAVAPMYATVASVVDRIIPSVTVVGLLACRGSAPEQKPPDPPVAAPAATFDPVLVAALCLVSLLPESPGTGHTAAGVVTNGKLRRPWVARSYDAHLVPLKRVEDALFLIRADNVQGML